MRFLIILLTISSFIMTSCFKGGESPATREDDKVLADMAADLKQLELDGYIIDNQIKFAHSRIEELAISPKMYDIAKKDLYQKKKFYQQIDQQISFLKIKMNNREKYFQENKSSLTKGSLKEEFKQYSMNKSANPNSYPWRIPSMKKAPTAVQEEKPSH